MGGPTAMVESLLCWIPTPRAPTGLQELFFGHFTYPPLGRESMLYIVIAYVALVPPPAANPSLLHIQIDRSSKQPPPNDLRSSIILSAHTVIYTDPLPLDLGAVHSHPKLPRHIPLASTYARLRSQPPSPSPRSAINHPHLPSAPSATMLRVPIRQFSARAPKPETRAHRLLTMSGITSLFVVPFIPPAIQSSREKKLGNPHTNKLS
ncbi:hypothetical protein GX51_03618 [Blastomyces parvus]|uniref:Uncharacterized protein n=1 Tax=Blastomyces parvus TaxID=2060905 RepID=A0A2B7X675_9EURO|nr:hypothetical protein GX51_03618 [Blastomyces parvus]